MTGQYQEDLGNDFGTRIEGTRIKHHMGPAGIKMYGTFGPILRIETTANDVSFFKHYRTVEQRNGKLEFKLAPVKKAIYSLQPDLRKLLAASNMRYLAFLSEIDDPTAGISALRRSARRPTRVAVPTRALTCSNPKDQALFEALVRGEFAISGMCNKDLRSHIPEKRTAQISCCPKRLRVHGLIKKVGRAYKYSRPYSVAS